MIPFIFFPDKNMLPFTFLSLRYEVILPPSEPLGVARGLLAAIKGWIWAPNMSLTVRVDMGAQIVG